VLRSNPVPGKIVTDQLRSSPAAKAEIPDLANVKHVFVKSGCSPQRPSQEPPPTYTRTRTTYSRFSQPDTHSEISIVLRADPSTCHVTLKRHQLRASVHRKKLAAQFEAWGKFTNITQNRSTGF